MDLNTMVKYNEKTINSLGLYLSKKISIPTSTELQCIEWNCNTNFITAGGSNGVLKVVKLAPTDIGINRDTGIVRLGAATNLSVNQSLEGHSGTVLCATWNEIHQKLTTSDSNGLIIVWSLHNEMWYEEMINNRNKSMPVGMTWNRDGTKVVIGYLDGQIIVGTLDGNRIWNKELGGNLAAVEWSPDGQILLFGMENGEVLTYDSHGTPISKLHMAALDSVEIETVLKSELRKDTIISMKWYAPPPKSIHATSNDSSSYEDLRLPRLHSPETNTSEYRMDAKPKLLIAYKHGVIQLMRNENDPSPIIARFANFTMSCARWSPSGGFVAVAGQQLDLPVGDRCIVYLTTAFGVKMATLKVQGNYLNGCAWDPTGMRIAITIDSHIFFGNIRPQYKWGYCGQTVVYAYEREDRNEFRVIFYETKLERSSTKPIKNLEQIVAFEDYCLIVNKQDDAPGHFMQLCNGIGTPVDFKTTDVDPHCAALNGIAAVIAGGENYSIWHFNVPKRTTLNVQSVYRSDRDENQVYVLDNAPVGNELGGTRRKFQRGNDCITSLCMADVFFLAACESGALFKILLSNGSVLQRFSVPQNIVHMQLNCTFRRFATLDCYNTLQFFDLDDTTVNKVSSLEKKDVWSFCWEAEKDDTIAYNEKTKMVIMRGAETEDPINCTGYICSFKSLTVRTVLVDNFLLHPDKPNRKYVVDNEVKSLREAKGLLERMKIQEASKFIERNPHPKLWSLLAQVALVRIDLTTAEHAYVMLGDYSGLELCKRLETIPSIDMKRAEIAAHLGRLDEAEKIYLENDRRDLAISMYKRVDDWVRILALLGTTGNGDDALRKEAANRAGDYYAERNLWPQAAKHYEQAREMEKLLNMHLLMDDYVGIDHIIKQLHEGDPLLGRIGEIMASSGLCEQAVDCFIRSERVGDALDICIQLNQWDKAVSLSRTHNLRDANALLSKYAEELRGSSERTLAAVQLYRRAGRFIDAARIVLQIAEDERRKVAPCLRLKKLYVLGALIIEEFHEYNKAKLIAEKGKQGGIEANATLSGLLSEESDVSLEDSRMIDKAWRGAEAYHFFMLAHTLLYSGKADEAMKTCLYLTEFDDILDLAEIYSLLALSSCITRQFSVCSRAMMKLEGLTSWNDEQKEEYKDFAMQLFTRYPPVDTRPHLVPCTNCERMIPDYSLYCQHCDNKFPMCIASGRPLMDFQFWLCPICKHRAYEQYIHSLRFCPLCHTHIA